MGENNMYYGIKQIPKGKIRGTPEYCAQTNQIRWWGIEKIDERLLKEEKIKDDAKIVVKEFKKNQIILEDKDATPSEIKMDESMVK